jgi:hypothetical protein
MFNGIFPTGSLVAPAGVISRPFTRRPEVDRDEDRQPDATEDRTHRAITAITAAVGR